MSSIMSVTLVTRNRESRSDVDQDCFWLREFHWCDFVFSKENFPEPKAMMTRLREKYPGIKFCVWINPYIGDASPVFAEAAEAGYLVKRPNGDVWQWDLWQAGMGLVDFTNPAACKWYISKLEYLFDVGVDCLKTDFGERIPDKDVQWHDKTVDPAKMHNFYSYIYNEVVYKALQKRYGADQAVLFARSATAGTQRFPLQWGGDCESTYEAMAESLRGGLSLGLSGFAYWSVDIGGFEGKPRHDVYKRWVAFGLLCSHSRLHGSISTLRPNRLCPSTDV
jgi:alpha-D-xyloside xylohydrolase